MAAQTNSIDAGDVVSWKAINRDYTAKVERMGGQLVCRLKNGKTFALGHILGAKSLKILKRCSLSG